MPINISGELTRITSEGVQRMKVRFLLGRMYLLWLIAFLYPP